MVDSETCIKRYSEFWLRRLCDTTVVAKVLLCVRYVCIVVTRRVGGHIESARSMRLLKASEGRFVWRSLAGGLLECSVKCFL